jgi:hypothetical protein
MTWGDGVVVIALLYAALIAAIVLLAAWGALCRAADRRIAAEFAAAGVPYGSRQQSHTPTKESSR